MIQTGLFDLEFRCRELEKNGDPLVKINQVVPWEDFRDLLNKIHEKDRKNTSGRKPFDGVLMFKILILQSLYNLSDDSMEYQIRDRISFMRFLGLNITDRVPDAKTIWLYREQLGELKLTKQLFNQFNKHLEKEGLKAKKGQIVDASIVSVPVQRNTREQNIQIKNGKIPEEWNEHTRQQKDITAKWTMKHGKRYYGYKNHVSVDVKHKLIRAYEVTDAAVHDSKVFEPLLNKQNTNQDVFGDSAYRSKKNLQILKDKKLRDRIHKTSYRWKKLSSWERQGNRTRTKTRVRVEHVFGMQLKIAKNLTLNVIGIIRIATKIGLRNLAYNIFRIPKLSLNI